MDNAVALIQADVRIGTGTDEAVETAASSLSGTFLEMSIL